MGNKKYLQINYLFIAFFQIIFGSKQSFNLYYAKCRILEKICAYGLTLRMTTQFDILYLKDYPLVLSSTMAFIRCLFSSP